MIKTQNFFVGCLYVISIVSIIVSGFVFSNWMEIENSRGDQHFNTYCLPIAYYQDIVEAADIHPSSTETVVENGYEFIKINVLVNNNQNNQILSMIKDYYESPRGREEHIDPPTKTVEPPKINLNPNINNHITINNPKPDPIVENNN